jgi:hypothetical protein
MPPPARRRGDAERHVLPRLQQRHADATGAITSMDVLIDVQGTTDLSNVTVNGQTQVRLRQR